MKAFVLAGGSGSRMAPYTDVMPKCLLPVNGSPCVRIIIQRMLDSGIEEKDVVLCINEWAQKHFAHEFRDLKIQFNISPRPYGTAGELADASMLIENTNILHYGDDLTKVDYFELINRHREWNADLTLASTNQVYLNLGLITIQNGMSNGRIVLWKEKPFLPSVLAWAAVAVFNRDFVDYLAVGKDISHDVIPRMMADGKKIYAYNSNSRWVDIGSLEHWKLANKLAKEGKI